MESSSPQAVFLGTHSAKCSGYLQPQEINYQLVTVKSLVIWHLAAWKSQQFGTWQTDRNLENPGDQASVASSLIIQMDCCGEFILYLEMLPKKLPKIKQY